MYNVVQRMSNDTTPQTGKVYLVGAGPGAVDLLTLRGLKCLQKADAVLYDYLANPQTLDFAAPAARLICLGRHGHGRIWSQDEINERLVELARAGKTVVRLKGGDPAIFSRTAEEVEALTAAGVSFEIVPGVTAALAAGSYAGIPVTHRNLASAVALVTGHEQDGKDGQTIDWSALAQFPGTLVVYMGVTTARQWTGALIDAGKSPDTPAAIVRHCSRPDQLTIPCRLGDVAEQLNRPQKIRPPVIVIIGPVTQVASTWSWFERLPLFGQRVLVTRPVRQAGELRDRLTELGAEVLLQPAIEIAPLDDWREVDDRIGQLKQFDWLVFTSRNGVRFFLDRVLAQGRDLRWLGHLCIAAIGPGTAEELAGYHLHPDVQPDEYRSEALAERLRGEAPGKRFLYAHASRGREVVRDELTAAGGTVEDLVVYNNNDVQQPDEQSARRLDAGEIDWVTVTSSAIARSLWRMFGDSLRRTRLASISPVTTAALAELGLSPAAEARDYAMDGIVAAILRALEKP